jgi:hypothetical protein
MSGAAARAGRPLCCLARCIVGNVWSEEPCLRNCLSSHERAVAARTVRVARKATPPLIVALSVKVASELARDPHCS